MRDAKLAVRTAYYNALNGQVSLAGSNVPVWDRVPAQQMYPYIKLSTQTSASVPSGKGACQLQESTLLIDIVTSFDGQQGGKQDSDLIAAQVLNLLTEGPLPTLVSPFKLMLTDVDTDFDLEETSPAGYIIRRLIRFRNVISTI